MPVLELMPKLRSKNGFRCVLQSYARIKKAVQLAPPWSEISSTESDDFGVDVAFEYVPHPISLLLMEIITHNGIKIPERFREDERIGK